MWSLFPIGLLQLYHVEALLTLGSPIIIKTGKFAYALPTSRIFPSEESFEERKFTPQVLDSANRKLIFISCGVLITSYFIAIRGQFFFL